MTRPEGYDLAISMYAFAEVPLGVRRAYLKTIVERSTRGWFSDHLAHSTTRSAMTLPQELLAIRNRASAVPGRHAPNITAAGGGLLSVRDFIMGQSPHEAKEAQVGWGATRDYYPALLWSMVHERWRPWKYPVAWRKLMLADQFGWPPF